MTDVDTVIAEVLVAIQDHLIIDDHEATETVENIASSAQHGRKSYSVEKKLAVLRKYDELDSSKGWFIMCCSPERPVLRGVDVPLSAAQIEKNPIPVASAMRQCAAELSGTYCKSGFSVCLCQWRMCVFQ